MFLFTLTLNERLILCIKEIIEFVTNLLALYNNMFHLRKEHGFHRFEYKSLSQQPIHYHNNQSKLWLDNSS